MPFTAHIQLGVLQRSKGRTLLHDAAYRMCEQAVDHLGRERDYRSAQPHHHGSTVLLPAHADEALSDPVELFFATAFRESRRDAQEGRTLVFSLPRVVPTHLVSCIAAYVLAPLVRQGMVIQLDVHEPLASDGLRHPHVHCWISQRCVEGSAFGLKCRDWNAIFMREARAFRTNVSTRMNRALAMLGIREITDPRSNAEAGRSPPLPRLKAHYFRQLERGVPVPEIEQLKAIKREEAELSISVAWIEPIPKQKPKGDIAQQELRSARSIAIGRISEAWRDRGDCTFRKQLGGWGIVLPDGCRVVATPTYVRAVSEAVSATAAKLMVELSSAMGWTAVVVDGPDTFVDTIVAEAFVQQSELMPVNRLVSEAAALTLGQTYREHFAEEITWMDRTGALARSLEQHYSSIRRSEAEAVSALANEEFQVDDFPQPRPHAEIEADRGDEAAELRRKQAARIHEISSSALNAPDSPERDREPQVSRD